MEGPALIQFVLVRNKLKAVLRFSIYFLAVAQTSEEITVSNLMEDTRRRRSLISERPHTSTSAIVRSYSSSSFESPGMFRNLEKIFQNHPSIEFIL